MVALRRPTRGLAMGSFPSSSPKRGSVTLSEVIGVDAAAGEWLGLPLADGLYAGADLQPTVADLLRRHPNVEIVGVDIPLGLPYGGPRPADFEARAFVGIGVRSSAASRSCSGPATSCKPPCSHVSLLRLHQSSSHRNQGAGG